MVIRVLDPEVASKIAAGEVIERPSFVVKELVENSLDAGSRQVVIEIAGGGLDLIRVTDNGSGIISDDLEIAFHRHATSKLRQISDLDSIVTLGFRGEALPSIAAVSKLSISTCDQISSGGRELHLLWGEVTRNTAKGCPPGTSICVQDIFGNLPGRRKFLKSPRGETARINSMVLRFVLAFPSVQIQLIIDDRRVIHSPGNGSLKDAISSIYGSQTADALLEVSWESQEVNVSGLISTPSLTRANRNYITVMVNNRWVQSPLLMHAISESYKDYVPDRRHPIAILNLDVPTMDVDVNVHPTKREVRFREEDKVFSILRRAIRNTLTSVPHIPEMGVGRVQKTIGSIQGFTVTSGNLFMLDNAMPTSSSMEKLTSPDKYVGPSFSPKPFPHLEVLGQLRNTYIVAEGENGLFLMDQHAAHERVVFEKLLDESTNKAIDVQALLEPVLIDVSDSQENAISCNIDILIRHGFNLEEFGKGTYLIRSVPSIIGNVDPLSSVLDMLDLMTRDHSLRDREEVLIASIACHGSVRAGKRLSQQEMDELARLMNFCRNPYHCPHGRPTIIHIGQDQLDREFGRR